MIETYNPSSLETKLNEDIIVPTTKEEEIIIQKKKINNKTKQIETRVQRNLLLEDGKIIADSGPKISTRTKETNEKNDSENEEKQFELKRENFKDKKLYEKLKNSDEYIELPHVNEIVSERIYKNNIIRECKQENYRFYDEKLKEIDGFDIHNKAMNSPQDLLKLHSNDQDSFSEDEIKDNQIQNNKFKLSKRNRGRLTHYSSKGYKIVDNDEEHEIKQYDENNQLVKKRYRKHNHEVINDDELPENMFNNSKYIEQLKDVAGSDFVKIPPKDYEFKPTSTLRQKSNSLTNLKSAIHRKENLVKDKSSFKQHSQTKLPLKQDEKTILKNHDRNMYRQTENSIINDNFNEKINVTKTYSTNTEDWVDNHFTKESNNLIAKSREHRTQNKENRMHHQSSNSYSRVNKEDVAVQASFTSDESSDEEKSKTKKPIKTFYFGEMDYKNYNEKSNSQKNNDTSCFKSLLKTTYSEPEIPYIYKTDLDSKFNNLGISHREYIHPIKIGNNTNNIIYSNKTNAYEPIWHKKDAKKYDPDFSSPYIRSINPIKNERFERLERLERPIPLRSSLTGKNKLSSYSTFNNYRSNMRSFKENEVKTNWPEFSPLNSPSEIVSTLRRKRTTLKDEFY